MKKLHRLLTVSLLTCSSLVASSISVDRMGIDLGIGSTTKSQDNKVGEIILGNEPDKTFYPSIELYGTLKGVFEDETMQPFVSYTNVSNNDLRHQYVLVGVNKYYLEDETTYYAGAYTGYSFFSWRYNPLNNTVNNDITSTAPVVGLQGGLEYPLDKNFSLDLKLQAMYHDNVTLLKTSTAEAEMKHRFTVNAGLGLVYKFK